MLLSSCVFSINILPASNLSIGILADDRSENSVTIVSVVRLTFLTIETRGFDYDATGIGWFSTFGWNYIIILTSVEANFSIICGQYMTASSSSSYERAWAETRILDLSSACLPSLGPVLSFISEKLELLRKRKSTHKRGFNFLMGLLPASKSAPTSVIPLSRRQSWSDGPNPMLDSSAIVEAEARNARAPELEADAPGPHTLEIGTVESILEMYSQRPTGELEGRSKSIAELEGGCHYAAEL